MDSDGGDSLTLRENGEMTVVSVETVGDQVDTNSTKADNGNAGVNGQTHDADADTQACDPGGVINDIELPVTDGHVIALEHKKVVPVLSSDSTDDSVALTDSAPATDADGCSEDAAADSLNIIQGDSVKTMTIDTIKQEPAESVSKEKSEQDGCSDSMDTSSEVSGFVVVKKRELESFEDLAGKQDSCEADKEDDVEAEEKKSSLSSLQQYRDRRSRPPVPNNVSDDTHDTGATDSDSDSSSDWMASSSSEMDDGHPRVKNKDAAAAEAKKKAADDLKTRGELGLNDLPPIEELKITVDENVVMHEVGIVSSVVGVLVIVQAKRDLPPLDSDTILFSNNKQPLGLIFETFGPVTAPFYSIRFNSTEEIQDRGMEPGKQIFYAPEMEQYTHYVFTEQLKRIKGSDASWEHNNEPPPRYLDYSDDEEERRAKAKLNKREEEEEDEEQQEVIGKKRKKRKPRKKPLNGYVADISDSDGFQSADTSGGSASMMQWPPPTGSQWRPPARPAWNPWSSSPRNHPSHRHRPGQDNRSRFEAPRERYPANWAPRPPGAMPRGPTQRGAPPAFYQPRPPPPHYPPPEYGHMGQCGPPGPPIDMRFVQNIHQDGAQNYPGLPHMYGGPPPHLRMPPPSQFGGDPRFPSGPQHNF